MHERTVECEALLPTEYSLARPQHIVRRIYTSARNHTRFYSPLAPGTLRLQLCEYSSVGAPGGGPDAIEAEPRHAVGARARVLCHSADEGLHRELLAVLADPLVRVRVRA